MPTTAGSQRAADKALEAAIDHAANTAAHAALDGATADERAVVARCAWAALTTGQSAETLARNMVRERGLSESVVKVAAEALSLTLMRATLTAMAEQASQ